ncbi:hypothetical protein GS425_04855 [Rhodococcus hoagii]|nr:hypothetical protein [Prescottella equi]
MNLAIESSGTPTDELFNNLSNILSTVAWAGMALGFLIMVVSAGRLAFAYDSYARSSALRGIIGESEPSSGSASPHYSARPDHASDTPRRQNQSFSLEYTRIALPNVAGAANCAQSCSNVAPSDSA